MRLRRLRAVVSAALVASVAGWVSVAFAHDGPPEPLTLHERPDDPDAGRWMTTTFGLVQTLNGVDWDVMCAEAVGYDEYADTSVLSMPSGALLVGSRSRGLFVSRDGGCSWAPHETFTSRGVSDLEGAPGQPSTVFVTTGKFSADNGLFRSDDDGFTFTQTLKKAETFFTGIRFAPTEPLRAYVSAWNLSTSTASLYLSEDGGQSFTETVPTLTWGDAFTLLAVSPLNPDELYASAYDETRSEYLLVRSTDSGATFSELARDAEPFRQIAFGAGAKSVFAAASRLFRSDDGGATFVKTLAPKRARCVQARAEEVETCASPLLDPYVLARVEADGGVTPTFAFNQIRGLLECPAGTQVHDTCSKIWPTLALLIGVPVQRDGGVVDAGTEPPDAGADETPAKVEGCGCDASSGGASFVALLCLGAWALRSRRRSSLGAGAAALLLALVPLLSGCPSSTPEPPDAGSVDACSPNPCTTPGRSVCASEQGHATCSCDFGFTEVAGVCVDSDPCDPNPCTEPNKTRCTLVGSAPACTCDDGYLADGSGGCRLDLPGDCSVQHVAGDDFEPDECPALARDIGGTGSQLEPHTIEPATDADWFQVTVGKGRVLRLRAGGGASPPLVADAWTGEPIARVGERQMGVDGVDAAWKAPADGPFYFRVRAQDSSATGPYAVSLEDLGFDDFGDDVASATSIPATNEPISGVIQFNGDADVLSMSLKAGHSYRLKLDAASTDEPVSLERLDGGGTVLWSTPLDVTASALTRTADGAPALFRIHAAPDVFNAGWTLSLTDLGEDDRGDTSAEAEPTAPGTMVAGKFERADDHDLFRFDAQAAHIYAVTCTPQGAGDCSLTLQDPTGAVIDSDTDGAQGLVLHEFDQAQQVTVVVGSTYGATFDYALSIEDRGLDDYGDDPGTATDIGMPQVMGMASGTGIIETSGDRDFIEFTADVDHIYRITCTPNSLRDCNLRVFNANGVTVASDNNGGQGFTLHEYNGGGQFFIEVSGAGAQTGSYAWLIEDLFHDDHGDDVFTATGMSANGAWVSGDLQTPGDNDWFKLPALAGHVYRFTCQRVSLSDCELRVYDLAENLEGSDVNGQDAQILYEVGAAQDEYLQVTAPGGQIGTYWIKAEDLGTDDCGDTVAAAGGMATGIAVNGAFETPGDVDVRTITLQAGTTYQLTASGTAMSFTLYAPDGTTILASGGTPATFTPTQTGAHYVAVQALGTLTGNYTLMVGP